MRTLQEYLGFAAEDRVLITHADDIGMCEATVSAWRALHGGNLTSASAMAPCPWFPAAVAAVREAGPSADMGLHLTLNCEWPHYRWRPLTGPDHPARLATADGTLHRLAADTYAHADLYAARAELEAQIRYAQQLGLPLTHLDSHMLTLWHPALLRHLLDLGRELQLPVLLMQMPAEIMAQITRMSDALSSEAVALIDDAVARGDLLPLAGMDLLPLDRDAELPARLARAEQILSGFTRPGVYCLIGHPACDTPELRAITSSWPYRVGDYTLFASREYGELIARMGFKTSGFRPAANTEKGIPTKANKNKACIAIP
ncbi:ChbG/HpnK family deacetylase [Chitinilyticum piscinae]|uniref:ChbG/HpnK family deacetylase n=1 Tax=Chitinilyticum piscinae TaxID=2866724 RepID=A0A8J7FKE5_9NEIS|nr:ChbG/HpnK family deacetylase [Chitinilyticum piscinae]MBE9609270.1 ChbG/HpnK family deacetylase [Chitinilyticum piscinae]